MKKMNYLIVLLLGVTLACVKVANTVSDSPEKIVTADLTSPNGVTIAESEKILMDEIKENVWKKSGVEENFDVIEITYLETKTETGAIITYQTVSGFEGNLIYVYMKEGNPEKKKHKIDCEADCNCKMMGEIKNDAISFSCSCSNCSMIVESLDD